MKHRFYFTFGHGTTHRNCFTVVTAETWEMARAMIMTKIGNKFAFQYGEEDWARPALGEGKTQQDAYGLTEIPFSELTKPEML